MAYSLPKRGIDTMPGRPKRGIDDMPLPGKQPPTPAPKKVPEAPVAKRSGPARNPANNWRFGFMNQAQPRRPAPRRPSNSTPGLRRRPGGGPPANGDRTFGPGNLPRRPGARRGDPTFGRRNNPKAAEWDSRRSAWRKRTQARVNKLGWEGYQDKFGDEARQQRPAWLKRRPASGNRRGPGRTY